MIVMTYPLIGNYGLTDEDYGIKGDTYFGAYSPRVQRHPSNFQVYKDLGRGT